MALSARFFSCIAIGIMCYAHVSFAQTQLNVPATVASAPYKTQPKAVKPLWSDLKPAQQSALAPLQAEWLKMSEIQKRKWLEISKNYNKLSADDQSKLHARMTDWARLSPEQRAQARLNFSTAKALSPDEKQKKWDAYQALSLEEKTKLEAKAKANTPNSAALAAKPQNKVLPGKHTTAQNPKSPTTTLVPTEK